MIRALEQLDVSGRRVLVRLDFDVPEEQELALQERVIHALPTLRALLQQGGRVIVAAHREGKPGPSLETAGLLLAEHLECDVLLPEDVVGDAARKVTSDLRPGQLALLENLSHEPGEAGNDDAFARKLAALCDAFVSDAPALLHRKLASLTQLPRFVEYSALGRQLLHSAPGLRELQSQGGKVACVFAAPELDETVLTELEAWLPVVSTLVLLGSGGEQLLRTKTANTRADTAFAARCRTLLENAATRDKTLTALGGTLQSAQLASALLDTLPPGQLLLQGPLQRVGLQHDTLDKLLTRREWVAVVGSEAETGLDPSAVTRLKLESCGPQVVRAALARLPLLGLEALDRLPSA